MRLLFEILIGAGLFALGHWTALHELETRSFGERIEAWAARQMDRLFHH
jgi:hypothetical protein